MTRRSNKNTPKNAPSDNDEEVSVVSKVSESVAYTSPGLGTPTMGEQGQPQPTRGSLTLIQDLKEKDLKMPARLCTFDEMALTPEVRQPLEITQILSLLSLVNGKVEPVKGSRVSEEAAEFLNYNFHNMRYGTWFSFCNNAISSLKYGFSLFNIVLEKRKYGEYAGSYCLSKLSPRSQHSLYGWMFDKNGRELLGIVQKPMQAVSTLAPSSWGGVLINYTIQDLASRNYTPIFNKNLVRFTHNETNNNPQGNSPLASCYEDWAELSIIQQYEVIGVSKDLGGLVVVRVRQELLDRAKKPDTYPEDYAAYCDLERQVANIHAGKQSFIILSDEMTEGKDFSYNIKLLGIEGSGKQYKTSEIIEQKKKNIYNNFGAGYLLLGQDSHGSYNLSSTGKLTHSFYVERNNAEFVSVINNDIIPKLLAKNGVYLSWKEMPKFVPSNPDQLSFDEASKFIQRTKSVSGLTKPALEYIYKLLDFPLDGIEELDFSNKGQSRAGESNGTSGTGSSQDGGANSATNMENTGVTKNFYLDWEDDEVYVGTSEDGEMVTINKDKRGTSLE